MYENECIFLVCYIFCMLEKYKNIVFVVVIINVVVIDIRKKKWLFFFIWCDNWFIINKYGYVYIIFLFCFIIFNIWVVLCVKEKYVLKKISIDIGKKYIVIVVIVICSVNVYLFIK